MKIINFFQLLYIIVMLGIGWLFLYSPAWLQWIVVILLLPIVLIVEHFLGISDFKYFKGSNNVDPSGNDNIYRKFTDYM